jgi:uncharacterized protein YecE (DUF72 family)
MEHMVRIGTSGFSYKEWVGSFYPPRTAGNKMLAYYAARMPTVEINYTFRAMPRPQMLEGWARDTPASFRFALKASQRITHIARLKNAQNDVDYFISVARALEERLGPTLFQLPPGLKKDVALLRDFLGQMNGRLSAAFEFRDRSWFDDAVFAALSEARAALCIAESDKLSTPVTLTAPYAYLRLRKEAYDEAGLAEWADRIADMDAQGCDAYVYLKHELAAPGLAATLRSLLDQRLGIAPQ